VVKHLHPKLKGHKALETAKRLFNREAEALYQLGTHDQIPKLFAHFEEQHEFYLVQEFIEGTLLTQTLKTTEPYSERAVVALLQDVLETLEFVHQQGVIHRDIKPSNLIRRGSDDKIVLIDFGAVKQIGVMQEFDDDSTSMVTVAVGSLGYMPNEQLAGKPRFSSDIYALGMIGIRALTGLLPSQLPDDPRTGELCWSDRAEASPELIAVLDQMVRYDFRQRYATAADALSALRSLHGQVAAIEVSQKSSLRELHETHLVLLERGNELFDQQRYREALTCFERLAQSKSQDYLVWFKRGITLEHLGRYKEAVESYDRVVTLRPDDYLAWFKQGKALEALHQYADAVKCYDEVIRLQPKNYWAWHDRGQGLEKSEQYEEAAAAYDHAVKLKPDFKLAVESRKRVLSRLQQVDQLYSLRHFEETVLSCDATLKERPMDALVWLMRGMALEKTQKYDGAIASYDRVVQLQPNDHLAWFKRGAVLELLHRYKDAALSYNRVVQLQPDSPWAWHDRGRVLERLEKYDVALLSYDKAVKLKADFQEAIEARQRLIVLLKSSREQKAIA